MHRKTIAVLLAMVLMLPAVVTVSAEETKLEPNNAVYHNGSPSAILKISDNSYLVADVFNRAVWSLTMGEAPVLLAGRVAIEDINERPVTGYNDSTLLDSAFASPWDIVPFLKGYLVSDSENNVLRYIDIKGDLVKTAVGDGLAGMIDAVGVRARLNMPTGLAADDDGNVYIADTGNNMIRMLDKKGKVTAYAGSTAEGNADGDLKTARFRSPTGLCYYKGSLYIADTGNHLIRKITGGKVETVAGVRFNPENDAYEGGGYVDGAAATAEFCSPEGIKLDASGVIYVADTGNSAIRKIENGIVTTQLISRTGMLETYPVSPRGLMFDGGKLYITDTFAGVIYDPVPAGHRTITVVKAKITFDDVAPDSWYATAVKYVSHKGLIVGAEKNKFAPEQNLSRAMAVTVLGRLCKLQKPDAIIAGTNTFKDVKKSDYFYDYVGWANNAKIVSGTTQDTFTPNADITRQDFVVMLYRYAKHIGFNTTHDKPLTGFSDKKAIAPYAVEAMQWADSWNIINGSDKKINPNGFLTRAEAAQILTKFGSFSKL